VPVSPFARRREYFVQSEEVSWDYLPSGGGGFVNGWNGAPIADDSWGRGPLGTTFLKCAYVAYDDETFVDPLASQPARMGLLGPLVRAVEGDEVRIVYRNKCRVTAGLALRGFRLLQVDGDDAPVSAAVPAGGTLVDGPAVATNATVELLFRALTPAGGAVGSMPVAAAAYTYIYGPPSSLASAASLFHAGLVGCSVVTRRGEEVSPDDPRARGIAEDIAFAWATFSELESPYYSVNLALANVTEPDFSSPASVAFAQSLRFPSVNG
jgi:hypothetical protein